MLAQVRRTSWSSLTLVCWAALAAFAQEAPLPDSKKPAPSVTTFNVGLLGHGSETDPQLMTLGLQFTEVRPGRASGDFAIGILPRALVEGFLGLGLRGGLALPMRMSGESFLIPSTGVSAVVLGGQGGGGGTIGANVGLSALFRGKSRGALRAGVTAHAILGLDEVVWLFELGFAP